MPNRTSKIFIQHRVNTSAQLAGLSTDWGVEIDLRSDVHQKGHIHLSHDAWSEGEDFEPWLAHFKKAGLQGPLILNTKEDGLETRALELLQKFSLTNYFFLDTALPTLIRWTIREKNPNFALRLSSHEPAAALESFRGHARWIWVDCFDGIPMDLKILQSLKSDFKICLVSPELQQKPLESIIKFGELYQVADAICTKSPKTWIESFDR